LPPPKTKAKNFVVVAARHCRHAKQTKTQKQTKTTTLADAAVLFSRRRCSNYIQSHQKHPPLPLVAAAAQQNPRKKPLPPSSVVVALL
jgi:hypothetical protein